MNVVHVHVHVQVHNVYTITIYTRNLCCVSLLHYLYRTVGISITEHKTISVNG